MKILSNFNTDLADELYHKAVDKFSSEKVMIVRRDPIYLWLKVAVPSSLRIIGVLVLLYIELQMINEWVLSGIMITIATLVIIILWLIGIRSITGKLIDYYMDFTLVTPKEILSYDQCGILKRSSISLDINNVRSVNEEKDGLLKSIFNYGTIIFFSEWDNNPDSQKWTIKLNYITCPRKLRDKIIHIIKD